MDLSLFINKIINEADGDKPSNSQSNDDNKKNKNESKQAIVNELDVENFIDSYISLKKIGKVSTNANIRIAFQKYCRNNGIKADGKLNLQEFLTFLKEAGEKTEQAEILGCYILFYANANNSKFFNKDFSVSVGKVAESALKTLKNSDQDDEKKYKDFINNDTELFNDEKTGPNPENKYLKFVKSYLSSINLNLDLNSFKKYSENNENNIKSQIDELAKDAEEFTPVSKLKDAAKNSFEDAWQESELNKSNEEAEKALKGTERAEKEIKSQQAGNPPSTDPETIKAMDDVMGRTSTGSTLRSKVFNVAVPTLSAASGEAENDTTLADFEDQFEDSFNKKLKAYEKPFTTSLTHADFNTNRAKIRKSESKKVKFESQEFFNKVILENGLKDVFNEIGAVAGGRKNIYQMFQTEKKNLIKKKDDALKELEDKVEKLREKYHTSLKGQKRYNLSFKIKRCYTDFLRKMEIAYSAFTELMDPYLKTLRNQEVKSAKKLDKIESKDRGLRGQFKEDELNRAKEKLNTLRGENVYEKLAMVSLYKIVSIYNPIEHSEFDKQGKTVNYTNYESESAKKLMAMLSSGKNMGLNFCIPENVKTYPINKNVTKYGENDFTDATVYDFSNCITEIPLRFLNKVFDQKTIKFIFSNPKIFNEIRKNESFKNAYDEFMKGYSDRLEAPKDKTAPNSSVKNGEGPAASLTISTKGEFDGKPNIEDPSYTELGFLSKITAAYKIVISLKSGKSLCYTDKQWEEFQKKVANPQQTVDQKVDENSENKSDNKQTENKSNEQKIEDDNPSQVETEALRKACVNIYDEIAKQFSDTENNYKKLNLKGEDTSNINLQYTKIKKDLNDFNHKKDGYSKLDYDALNDLFHSLETLSRNITDFVNTVESLPQAKANNSKGLFFQAKNKLSNITNKIKEYLKDIQEAKRAGVKYGPRKAEQIAVKDHANNYSNENATVTTAAADSTYGNGYNYKPKRIREIIYKKGDYTVKTKEEI